MSFNLRKFVQKLIPYPLKKFILRRSINLTTAYKNQDIQIKLATTEHEIESAYKLLHDAYVQQGLMDPDASGLRLNLYSVLPYTSVIIAKKGDLVIGTVSLIKDSPIGFPSDKAYKKENEDLRNKGHNLVEVSALAIHESYRRSQNAAMVSLLIMKYLFHYAEEHMGSDLLCATIHPRAFIFYDSLFGFEKNGEVTEYNFVKKALAIHISLDLTRSKSIVEKISLNQPRSKNLFEFFVNSKIQQLHFRQKNPDLLLDPVMTPEILENLFIRKSNMISTLSLDELHYIKWAYSLHFPLDQIPNFQFALKSTKDRMFRYLSNISVVLLGQTMYLGKAKDISTGGLFFSSAEIDQIKDQIVTVVFNINKKVIQIKAKTIRHRNTGARLGKGLGIQFLEQNYQLIDFLKKSHKSKFKKQNKEEIATNVIPLFPMRKAG
ncbi:MAG TPA: PilZ domain-containing protein [Pseudobdellovibrionaceae bacterium]|nr:PilZ domain-containing protein [Pseudobdellovibrionaceae bacterium]